MEVGLSAVLCEHSCVKAEGFLDQHVFTDIIRQTPGRFIKKCIELTCWEVVCGNGVYLALVRTLWQRP